MRQTGPTGLPQLRNASINPDRPSISPRHLRRHMRWCRQGNGCSRFAQPIGPCSQGCRYLQQCLKRCASRFPFCLDVLLPRRLWARSSVVRRERVNRWLRPAPMPCLAMRSLVKAEVKRCRDGSVDWPAYGCSCCPLRVVDGNFRWIVQRDRIERGGRTVTRRVTDVLERRLMQSRNGHCDCAADATPKLQKPDRAD